MLRCRCRTVVSLAVGESFAADSRQSSCLDFYCEVALATVDSLVVDFTLCATNRNALIVMQVIPRAE
jgi:hypothetical protein